MRHVHATTIIFVIMASLCLPADAQDKKATTEHLLNTGNYDLKIHTPSMKQKENQDTTTPAELEIVAEELVIKTQDSLGVKIVLRGIQKNGTVKYAISQPERDKIITLYFVGEISASSSASGKFYCIVDAKLAIEGTWSLEPKQDKGQEEIESK